MSFTVAHNAARAALVQAGLAALFQGSVWYVCSATSGASTTDGGQRPASPFSTISAAVSAAAAGDTIIVLPGHTETCIAAGTLTISKALTIIGIGTGSLRPTVNFTTAVGASVRITAANVSIRNFLFTGGIDALTGPVSVEAADCSLLDIETRDVTGQATDFIVTTAAATRLLIDGWFHNGAAAAGANSALALVGVTNPVVRNFRVVGNFAVSAIDLRTTASVDVNISRGYIWNKNSADVCIKDTVTASTGRIGPDLELMLTDNAANITEAVTGATFHLFDPVYVCNLVNEKAMLINWTASTDA